MKGIKRVCIFLITLFFIINIFLSNISVVEAKNEQNKSSESYVSSSVEDIGSGTNMVNKVGSFKNVISKVLGLLRLLTGLLSIVVIAYTGFEMVVETPEGKKKVKEKMVPIVVGVVLVFMASTIASFIIGVFEGSSTTNNSSGGGGGNPTSQSAVK